MSEYLIMVTIIVATVLAATGLSYLKFRWGLPSKIAGVLFAVVGLCSFLAFLTGKLGTTPDVIGVCFPIVLIALPGGVYFLYRITVRPLNESVTTLLASTAQVSSAAQQSASMASQQASTVAEVTATIEEINETSRAAAVAAREVVDGAENAVVRGEQGMETITAAVGVMRKIGARVEEVTERIVELSKRNSQIVEIVGSVNELAEQSNLLAVNASIEAAKAGEQGRGFAVVASEVRSLAEQSKVSTKQIRRLLDEIQRSSDSVVGATELATTDTQEGFAAIDSVRVVIEELAGVLTVSADSARQIAGSASQQAAGIKQISEAMDSVADGGQATASSATMLEETVGALTDTGQQLDRIVTG